MSEPDDNLGYLCPYLYTIQDPVSENWVAVDSESKLILQETPQSFCLVYSPADEYFYIFSNVEQKFLMTNGSGGKITATGNGSPWSSFSMLGNNDRGYSVQSGDATSLTWTIQGDNSITGEDDVSQGNVIQDTFCFFASTS
jgi:hypothetical protein